MRKDMNPLVSKSPFAGTLVEEQVPGATSGNLNPENNVETGRGQDRTMFVYVPRSGCPHPKQTKVLMVLRDEATEESAQALLDGLGIAELAEEGHFVVVFPNPLADGWNYSLDEAREDDAAFIVRCFAALPGSKGGVAGFNGMICHFATSPAASAMVATLAATRPLDAAAIMVGSFPEGYEMPEGKGAQQVAWLYEANDQLANRLAAVRQPGVENELPATWSASRTSRTPASATMRAPTASRPTRWPTPGSSCSPRRAVGATTSSASTSRASTSMPAASSRTWATPRSAWPTACPARGSSTCPSACADPKSPSPWSSTCMASTAGPLRRRAERLGRPRRPRRLRLRLPRRHHRDALERLGRPAPAERHGLHSRPHRAHGRGRAGRPPPHLRLGLLDGLDDDQRAGLVAYPEVFAGAISLNGPHVSYLETLDDSKAGLLAFNPRSRLTSLEPCDAPTSPSRDLSDEKKRAYDYRMPIVQFAGLADPMGMPKGRMWPLTAEDQSAWSWAENAELLARLQRLGRAGVRRHDSSGFASRHASSTWARASTCRAGSPQTRESPVYYRFVTVERLRTRLTRAPSPWAGATSRAGPARPTAASRT